MHPTRLDHEEVAADVLRHLQRWSTTKNPLTSKSICSQLGINQVLLREAVHLLRCRGYAVASSGDGYWFTTSVTDINQTIAHGVSRINSIREWVWALEKVRSRMQGPPTQTELVFDGRSQQ